MGTDGTETSTRLKEHLYRAEAERLLLQQKTTVLDDERQQLSADVHKLQQQLAAAHAAFVTSQQHNQQLSSERDQLQVQVEAAVREYRANDIICCGLRDAISRLQRQLADSQETCRQQVQGMATLTADMQDLHQCKADITEQLSNLQQQHQQLEADHNCTLTHLSATQSELSDSKRRWLDEHGDMARTVQDIREGKQQLQAAVDEQTKQLEEHKQQLKDERARCAEFEAEVCCVRDIVMVLGKAIGKQPRGQELPSHDDAVWARLGPLGGVQFALEVVMKHTRAQDAKLKGVSSELSRMEDRVRSESAQQAELQSGLYEVRALYAKAISDRESLEARAARAEAEKVAADTNWQRAKAQAADDSTRLAELQEAVMSLTKQVQQLLPLQPRCSTLEVERDTATNQLHRLQEQHDQLQRQHQQAVAREAELSASLDTYKAEHMQLLNANAKLVEKCHNLNTRVQVLEISTREGNLAVGQLEEMKKRLCSTQSQLDAMSDSHARTLSRLETATEMLHGAPGDGSELSSGGHSPRSRRSSSASRRTSDAGGAHDRAPSAEDQAAAGSTAAATSAGAAPTPLSPRGPTADPPSATETPTDDSSAQDPAGRSSLTKAASAHAQPRHRSSGVGAVTRSDSPLQGRRSRPLSAFQEDEQAGLITEDDVADLPPEVAQLLKRRGLEDHLSSKHKKWHELKASVLSCFTNKLRKQLLQQTEFSAQLELLLLQQEAQQLQLMHQQEDAATRQCMAAAAAASAALQQVLTDLRHVMAGGDAPSSHTCSDTAAAGGSSSGVAEGSTTNSSDASTGLGISSTATTSGLSSWESSACRAAAALAGEQVAGHQRSKWLHAAVSTMMGNLRTAAAEALARAELIAARRDVAVQSDESQQTGWLQYVASVPAAPVTHQLHEKAVAETIVRVYVRALQQLEASWAQELQQRQARPSSGRPVGTAGPDAAAVAAAAAAEPGAGVSTLFEALMGHYSQQQQQQQHGQQRAWQVQNASLWKDPQGPISRLLVSCQPLAGSSTKVALFCRLAGTHRQPGRAAWGAQHWQHFLLVLHAAKRLVGGLWKSVLRDWALAAGARLPLQCVHDLLGNVYNVSHLAELDRLPALLNTRQALLEQQAGGAAHAAREQPPSAPPLPAEPGSSSSRNSREQGSVQASRQQRGSVSAALRELLVDGPVGPAVDLDELLAMIMLQFDAGLLPANPLMEPRRLTDGSLANTNNAWGQAALQLACPSSDADQARASNKPGTADRPAPDRADSSRSDWCRPSNMSGISSGASWLSRPTTGAAVTAKRAGTAAAAASAAAVVPPLPGDPSSPAVPGLLPRLRTPDSAAPGGRPSSATGTAGSLQAASSHHAALIDIGGSFSSSSAVGSPGSPGSPGSKIPTATAQRVAFQDAPAVSSIATRPAVAMKKFNSGAVKGRMGQ